MDDVRVSSRSMIGIALPIVAGIWIMPSGESVSVRIHSNGYAANGCCSAVPQIPWMDERSIRQWPLLGSIRPSSTVRHG